MHRQNRRCFWLAVLLIGNIAMGAGELYAETVDAFHLPGFIEGVWVVSPQRAHEYIRGNPAAIIIDTRSRTDYRRGHIRGAKHLFNTTMRKRDLARIVAELDTPILFYSNGEEDRYSYDAIQQARSWGYSNLIWLRDGWSAWQAKDLPAITP